MEHSQELAIKQLQKELIPVVNQANEPFPLSATFSRAFRMENGHTKNDYTTIHRKRVFLMTSSIGKNISTVRRKWCSWRCRGRNASGRFAW